MAHQKPVMLPLTKQPRPVQWAIAFHAWLLTWLPESYPDRDVIAVTFEEQCLEAYQVGLGWWLDVVVWAWGDVGITASLTRFSEFRQRLRMKIVIEYIGDNPEIPSIIIILINLAFYINIDNISLSLLTLISFIAIYILIKGRNL